MLDPNALGPQLAAGKGLLGFMRGGRMELLAVDMVSGKPEHIVRLPQQTFLPLWTALATGSFFLALLFKLYWLAPVAFICVIVFFLFWSGDTAEGEDVGDLDIGDGRHLPVHIETDRPPSWWAMVFALTADATAYVSLLFGALFLWISAPNWPPQELAQMGVSGPALAAVASLVAAFAGWRAASHPTSTGWLLLTVMAHLAAAGTMLWLALTAVPDPRTHAAAASVFVVIAYAALHNALGAVFAGYGIWRVRSGFVSPRRCLDLRIGSLWHQYSAGVALAATAFPFVLTSLVTELGQ